MLVHSSNEGCRQKRRARLLKRPPIPKPSADLPHLTTRCSLTSSGTFRPSRWRVVRVSVARLRARMGRMGMASSSTRALKRNFGSSPGSSTVAVRASGQRGETEIYAPLKQHSLRAILKRLGCCPKSHASKRCLRNLNVALHYEHEEARPAGSCDASAAADATCILLGGDIGACREHRDHMYVCEMAGDEAATL